MNKIHFLKCYAEAVRSGFHHYAEALASLYLKEFGEPMPSPDVSAVAAFLASPQPERSERCGPNGGISL